MRTKNSIINIAFGLGNQLIIIALSFISRKVFLDSLGLEYLGINGLFSNILAMLTLAEAGIGSSIVYSLYRPVAENNIEKINVLMRLYKKAYRVIAVIILLLGLALLPFLGLFIKDSNVPNINLIYVLFLINTVLPYLFLHKNSFLNVCQKTYIVTGLYSVSSIISVCLKIGILYYTQNYIVYLMVDIFINLITSLILMAKVDKLYPFLRNRVSTKLDAETRTGIIKNIKAIVLQNVGGYFVFGTDNIIISSFVSVAAVGLYSNYNMLIEVCRTFINQIFNNIYHSVGNLVAVESKDKVYHIYCVYRLVNFWVYSFFAIFLCIITEPFISLWLGSDLVLDKSMLFILILIFYERGMRNSITTVKTTAGIFHEDRFAPLFQAVVNLIVSITLVQYIGMIGVFIGTLVSALLVPFWITPYLAYKKVFEKPVVDYFTRYAFYAAVGLGTYFITAFICSFFGEYSVTALLLKGAICVAVVNCTYLVIFHKTEEFNYLFVIVAHALNKITALKKKFSERFTGL